MDYLHNSLKLGDTLEKINWSSVNLKPIQKIFYQELESVKNMDQNKLEQFITKHQIHAFGKYIFNPVITFQESQFPKYIMDIIFLKGYKDPTPIQSVTWPLILSGKNVVGIAETGSGKTLAYLLPAIIHINAQDIAQQGEGPIVLILSPTRELAQQIYEEAKFFTEGCSISTSCIFGGAAKYSQQKELSRGVELLIATPGRLIDFLEQRTINLQRVTYLVLDEADKMLDMGLEKYIRKIFTQIRPDRQLLMFTATWPEELIDIEDTFCSEKATRIIIGSIHLKANHMIKQNIHVIGENEKLDKLLEILNGISDKTKVLIFCDTKKLVEELHNNLKSHEFPVIYLHGSLLQEED